MLTDSQAIRLELQRIITHAERIAADVQAGTEVTPQEVKRIREARTLLQRTVAR